MKFLMTAFVAFFVATSAASAATYTLGNHPDGANTPNYDYGLRVDDISAHYSAVLGNANLTWDGGATAKISGSINLSTGATADDSDITGITVFVEYNITGVSGDGNGGFTATGGSGAIWDTNTQYDFVGKQNNGGLASIFAFDGHRLSGDNSTGVFRGWIMDAGSCNIRLSSIYFCHSDGSTGGTNDFLMVATAVPLPTAGLMLLAGLGGLAATRKRKA